MSIVNIYEAKTQLSKLLDHLLQSGESVTIAKAGKPIAKLVPFDAPLTKSPQRTGFLAGQMSIPDDFDTMAAGEVADLFGVK